MARDINWRQVVICVTRQQGHEVIVVADCETRRGQVTYRFRRNDIRGGLVAGVEINGNQLTVNEMFGTNARVLLMGRFADAKHEHVRRFLSGFYALQAGGQVSPHRLPH